MGIAEKRGSRLYNSYKAVVIVHRIKLLRVEKGMKQSELAKLLNCSATTVSNYEVGIRDIDSATIIRLCEIFGCTADYLLGRSDLPTGGPSEEEQALILAFRRADEHIRAIVRTSLEPFMQEDSSQKAI